MRASTRKPGSLPKRAEATVVDPNLQKELRSLMLDDEEVNSPQTQSMMLLEEEQNKQAGKQPQIFRLEGESDYELLGQQDLDEKLITEFNGDISKVNNDLKDIFEIMNDIGMQVEEQGERLEDVATNTQHANEEIEEGLGEIAEAQRIKSRIHRRNAIIAGASTGAVSGAVAGAFLGPIGGTTGAVVGAIAGTGLGVGAGFGIGKVLDQTRQADQLEIDLQQSRFFVPFDYATLCLNCGSEFGVFRHRHHCHSCGRARICTICIEKNQGLTIFEAGAEAQSSPFS